MLVENKTRICFTYLTSVAEPEPKPPGATTFRVEPEPPEMWRLRSVSHIEKPLVNACLKAIRFRKRFEAEPLFSTL